MAQDRTIEKKKCVTTKVWKSIVVSEEKPSKVGPQDAKDCDCHSHVYYAYCSSLTQGDNVVLAEARLRKIEDSNQSKLQNMSNKEHSTNQTADKCKNSSEGVQDAREIKLIPT